MVRFSFFQFADPTIPFIWCEGQNTWHIPSSKASIFCVLLLSSQLAPFFSVFWFLLLSVFFFIIRRPKGALNWKRHTRNMRWKKRYFFEARNWPFHLFVILSYTILKPHAFLPQYDTGLKPKAAKLRYLSRDCCFRTFIIFKLT